MISRFTYDCDQFMRVWKDFTMDRYACQRIKENHLIPFFIKLGEIGTAKDTLGFSEETLDIGEMKKEILRMGIKCEDSFIYFNELLYRVMKRKYCDFRLSTKMQIYELRTQYRLALATQMMISNQTIKNLDNEQVKKKLV